MLGHAVKPLFAFDQDIVNLNHGSAGTVAKPVFEAQLEAIHRRAAFPDNYYRPLVHGQNLRTHERELIAKVVDADPECVYFAQNTSVATSTILWSFPFAKGDKIVYPSTTFPALKLTLEYIAQRTGAELVEFRLNFPLSDADLLKEFEQLLETHKPRLAVYDTVSSTPAIGFPWEEMTEICNKRGVLSLIDGAHGIGLIEISLKKAKPTFFASNIHKWFWTSQGLALVYVDKSQHSAIQTFPMSHVGHEDLATDRLVRGFAYTATFDYTAIDSVPAAYKFRNDLGGEKVIVDYNTQLAEKAAQFVCQRWDSVELNPRGRRVAMFNVKSPVQPQNLNKFCVWVPERMRQKHRAAVALFEYQGEAWVRFSAAAFLELGDFEYGLDALEECFEAYSD